MKPIGIFVIKASMIVIRVVFVGAILMVSISLAYLIWRASQPMEMPQFNDLSYYQLVKERRQAYIDLAKHYQASNPGQVIHYEDCFLPESGVQIIVALPTAGFYVLAGMYPDLQKYINPRDIQNGLMPEHATWFGYLPAWWSTFEKFVWGMVIHAPHGPVPYCRVSPP